MMGIHFDILTIFPEAFGGIFNVGMVRKARQAGLVSIAVHHLRDYTTDRHHTTDDAPYGGGGGMIMKPEPIFKAVEAVLAQTAQSAEETPIILLSPQAGFSNMPWPASWRRNAGCSSFAGAMRAWTSECANSWRPTRFLSAITS